MRSLADFEFNKAPLCEGMILACEAIRRDFPSQDVYDELERLVSLAKEEISQLLPLEEQLEKLIAALLTYDEKWVDKIENALTIFKENQDEVALLWRPHPLIESTMKSMRPTVLEKYMVLKDNYISEGWGIWDETADVDRAVVLSDAYYGDPSSLVQLYQQTGKPIMIQNVEIMT